MTDAMSDVTTTNYAADVNTTNYAAMIESLYPILNMAEDIQDSEELFYSCIYIYLLALLQNCVSNIFSPILMLARISMCQSWLQCNLVKLTISC